MADDDMIVDDEANTGAESTDADESQAAEGALLDNDEPTTSANDEGAEAAGDEEAEDGSESGGEDSDAADEAGDAGSDTKRPDYAQPPAPEPVADPGTEFTPKNDYAFDIELADGKKIHVTKPEDIENLPADADFGTPANLMKAQAKLNVMTTGIDQERRDWETNKEKFEAQQTSAKDTEARVATMVAEMNYLEAKGKLPKVDPKYENADWSDAEVAKQPGVKERMELLDYRATENEQRAKLGLSPMSLLEAHLQIQQDEVVTKATETKNKQAEQRKAKGAMVGGTGSTPVTNIPDDMIVGDGGSIRDLNPAY